MDGYLSENGVSGHISLMRSGSACEAVKRKKEVRLRFVRGPAGVITKTWGSAKVSCLRFFPSPQPLPLTWGVKPSAVSRCATFVWTCAFVPVAGLTPNTDGVITLCGPLWLCDDTLGRSDSLFLSGLSWHWQTENAFSYLHSQIICLFLKPKWTFLSAAEILMLHYRYIYAHDTELHHAENAQPTPLYL